MGNALTYTGTLVVTECWCGIALAIPANLSREAHEQQRAVYCPLGHEFVYRDTYEQKLAAERRKHAATRELLAAEERSHAATRGQMTRLRKRVEAGVCPHCNRTFQNLARHVKSQHTDHPEVKP